MSNTIKYKLEDFAESNECVLIGIVSSVPDYTICWHINKLLNINLYRCADAEIEMIQKSKKHDPIDLFSAEIDQTKETKSYSSHHIYKFYDEQFYSEYYFLANKGTQLHLDASLKKVNYFLEIVGMKSENFEQLIFELNSIEPISLAYFISHESLLNKLKLVI
jgi:hypothetical protein